MISIVMAMMTIQPRGNPDRVDMGRMPMNASRGRRQGGSGALGLSGGNENHDIYHEQDDNDDGDDGDDGKGWLSEIIRVRMSMIDDIK